MPWAPSTPPHRRLGGSQRSEATRRPVGECGEIRPLAWISGCPYQLISLISHACDIVDITDIMISGRAPYQ